MNLKKICGLGKWCFPDTLLHLVFPSAAWPADESHLHCICVITQELPPVLRLARLAWQLCPAAEVSITPPLKHRHHWPREIEGRCLVSSVVHEAVCSRVHHHVAVNKKWCFEVTIVLSVSIELVLANKEIPEKCCRNLPVLHLLTLHENHAPLAARLHFTCFVSQLSPYNWAIFASYVYYWVTIKQMLQDRLWTKTALLVIAYILLSPVTPLNIREYGRHTFWRLLTDLC